MKPKIGWLVLRLKQKMETNFSFPLDMANHPDIWGVCLVFRRKKEAEEYAGKDAKVYPVSFPGEAEK